MIGNNAATLGFRTRATAIGADAQVDADNTIVLGTTIDTVAAPNLLKAKNITVSSKVEASTVDAVVGIFDEIRLNNTPLGGDKPLCQNPTTKKIGLCPTSSNAKIDGGAASLANAVNEQNAVIVAQQKQLQQQQILIKGLRKLVCLNNAEAAVCQP